MSQPVGATTDPITPGAHSQTLHITVRGNRPGAINDTVREISDKPGHHGDSVREVVARAGVVLSALDHRPASEQGLLATSPGTSRQAGGL